MTVFSKLWLFFAVIGIVCYLLFGLLLKNSEKKIIIDIDDKRIDYCSLTGKSKGCFSMKYYISAGIFWLVPAVASAYKSVSGLKDKVSVKNNMVIQTKVLRKRLRDESKHAV